MGYGFALVGRKSDAPSVRCVKGRDEPEAGLPEPKRGFHPTDEDLSVGAPGLNGLLLGRAPPARGLPLLVVKGRDEEVGRSKAGRLGRGLSEPDRPKLGRSEYDRGALGRAPPARGLPPLVEKGRSGPVISSM